MLYPGAWEPYFAHIPENERSDLLSPYHRRLTSDDPAVRLAAAKIWSGWEGVTSKLLPDAAFAGHYEEDEFALAFARIEVHYFLNKGFFETDDQLLRGASRIPISPVLSYRAVTTLSAPWRARGRFTVRGPRPISLLLPTAATALLIRRTVAPWWRRRTDSPSVDPVAGGPRWCGASARQQNLRSPLMYVGRPSYSGLLCD